MSVTFAVTLFHFKSCEIRRTTTIFRELLINYQIKDKEVRLIGADGTQLGVMLTVQAKQMAESKNLDLVMISPNANPPVCKLMDYAKYRFDLLKKEKDDRKNQKNTEMKDIWLSHTIDVGDLETKVKMARKFVAQGSKVRFSIRMKGRQQAHPEISVGVMNDAFAKLEDIAVIEKRPLQEGRSISMIVAPIKK